MYLAPRGTITVINRNSYTWTEHASAKASLTSVANRIRIRDPHRNKI